MPAVDCLRCPGTGRRRVPACCPADGHGDGERPGQRAVGRSTRLAAVRSPAFTDGNVTDAENDADSVDSTFTSRQPRDSRSDAPRQKMLQALSDGTSALTDLRVAVRMDNPAQVRQVLAEVGKSVKTFNDLQQELH
jgi:hypothetical protein